MKFNLPSLFEFLYLEINPWYLNLYFLYVHDLHTRVGVIHLCLDALVLNYVGVVIVCQPVLGSVWPLDRGLVHQQLEFVLHVRWHYWLDWWSEYPRLGCAAVPSVLRRIGMLTPVSTSIEVCVMRFWAWANLNGCKNELIPLDIPNNLLILKILP